MEVGSQGGDGVWPAGNGQDDQALSVFLAGICEGERVPTFLLGYHRILVGF